MKSNSFDIAIVGAGIGGIYTAWRIVTEQSVPERLKKLIGGNHKPTVAVFEMSSRIGGRLLSAQSTYAPESICELGGMRYVSSQVRVRSLVENKLKLGRHQQTVDVDQNLVFLRGRQMHRSDTFVASRLPYRLRWAEEQALATQGASGLISNAIAQIVPEVNTLSGPALREILKAKSFEGTPLYQHGFWNLLARVMSTEAYQLARTMSGFDLLGGNTNAVDLIIEFFDFAPGVVFSVLNDGYDKVPWVLKNEFEAGGGKLFTEHRLEGFDQIDPKNPRKGVKLDFHGGHSYTAKALVMAMPRRSIELLDERGPLLTPERSSKMRSLMDTVEAIPLYKLVIVYPFPWWKTAGVSTGRSLTDLPLHQCYYWPNGASGTMLESGPGVIMAYNDQASVAFWGGLATTAKCLDGTRRSPRPLKGDVETHEGRFTRYLQKNWEEHRAPNAMVAEMHRQLMAMHDVCYAPQWLDAAFVDWSQDPYGGAVHFWKIGHRSWDVVHRMIQPVEHVPCYVCGEAWSTNQSWAEGALETSELLLQDHFGLPAPSWLQVTSLAETVG